MILCQTDIINSMLVTRYLLTADIKYSFSINPQIENLIPLKTYTNIPNTTYSDS